MFELPTTLLLVFGAILIAGYILLSPRFAERLYHPALFEPHPFPDEPPALPGTTFEDVMFDGPAGKLHGWFFPVEKSAVVVLLHHGNTGNLSDLDRLLGLLLQAGVSVFAYDYRGYGKSVGTPCVAGICQDSLAAYDWLVQRCPSVPIVSYGESLGGAVASYTATQRRMSALILQSTFSELRIIARETHLLFSIWPSLLFPRPYFNSGLALKSLSLPLLVIHGARDPEVSPRHADVLHAAAPEPRELVVLPHTLHEEIAVEDSELFVASVRNFIAAHFPSTVAKL